MLIRIEATDLPGRTCGPGRDGEPYGNVHVAVQRRSRPSELLDPVPGDAIGASWALEATVEETPDGFDVTGAYVQGRPGGRFIYLSWGAVTDAGWGLFRRAKLMIDDVPAATLDAAVRVGLLVGRLGLTDAHGHPLCVRVRPPAITWTAGD